MFTVLLVLAALTAVAVRATTADERRRLFEAVVVPTAAAVDRVVWANEPFRARLYERTPRLIAVPVLVGLSLLAFGAMLAGAGPLGDPATLVDWGASYGPRTTAGEWWRLVAALFVPLGTVHAICTLVALAQVGELLERVVGPLTVTAAFLLAGVGSGLIGLVEHPLAVHTGASGATMGLYGLLLGVALWGAVSPTGLAVPLPAFQSLLPGTVLFLAYETVGDTLASRAHLTGLVIGLGLALALAARAGQRPPAPRALAIAVGAGVLALVATAIPLRGIVDIRPGIAQVVAREDRTVGAYRAAVSRFTRRRQTPDPRVLNTLIEGTILRQLSQARDEIAALGPVRDADQALLATAVEYLQLREASWQRRAEGLRTRDVKKLLEAETIERTSLALLTPLRHLSVAIAVRS